MSPQAQSSVGNDKKKEDNKKKKGAPAHVRVECNPKRIGIYRYIYRRISVDIYGAQAHVSVACNP
jgi:hypothetical protein